MADSAVQNPPAAHVYESHNNASTEIEMERLGEPEVQPTASTKKSHNPITWWKRHIAQEVPFHACRDYYALERTYLAWVRTSVKFAHFGIIVAQLFRIPKDVLPSSPAVSQFYRLGKPLGLVSISLAILVILIGGIRCWEQQRLIASGKVRSCGWEIWTAVVVTLGLIIVLLVFVGGDAATKKPF